MSCFQSSGSDSNSVSSEQTPISKSHDDDDPTEGNFDGEATDAEAENLIANDQERPEGERIQEDDDVN